MSSAHNAKQIILREYDTLGPDRNIRSRSHSDPPTSAIERAGASQSHLQQRLPYYFLAVFGCASFLWGRTSAMTVSPHLLLSNSLGHPSLLTWPFSSLPFFELLTFLFELGPSEHLEWQSSQSLAHPQTKTTVLACSCIYHPFSKLNPSHRPVMKLTFPNRSPTAGRSDLGPLFLQSLGSFPQASTKPFSSARDKIACARAPWKPTLAAKGQDTRHLYNIGKWLANGNSPCFIKTQRFDLLHPWRTVPFLIRTPILALRPVPTMRAAMLAKPRHKDRQ